MELPAGNGKDPFVPDAYRTLRLWIRPGWDGRRGSAAIKGVGKVNQPERSENW